MYRKIILAIITLILAVSNFLIIGSGTTFAAEGTGNGSGGVASCAGTLSTCYGATWKYYTTSSDSVAIAGLYSSSNLSVINYAKATTISGCKNWGGYWRYAMVAQKNGPLSSYVYRTSKNGSNMSYSPGQQVGIVGISKNSDQTFDSEFFRGAGHMNYIPANSSIGNTAWATVKDIYTEMKKYDSSLTQGFDANSSLAWFCGPKAKSGVVRYTLTADAYDDAGTKIKGSISTSTVLKTKTATVSHSSYAPTGYTWYKWESGATGASYSKSNMSANTTVKAYYKRNTYKLTASPINTSGSSISVSGGTMSHSVPYKTKATVTRGTATGYTFKGWATSVANGKAGTYASTSASYSVNSLTANTTIYAVYQINSYTLTATPVLLNESGTKITAVSPFNNNATAKANYNSSATVSLKSTWTHANFDFKGWSTADTGASPSSASSTSYSKTMTANYTIYPVYKRKALPCSGECKASIAVKQSKTSSDYATTTIYVKPNDEVYLQGTYTPPNTDAAYMTSYKNAFAIIKHEGACSDTSGWSLVANAIGNSSTWAAFSKTTNYTAKVGTSTCVKSKTNFNDDVKTAPSSIKFAYDSNSNLSPTGVTTAIESSGVTAVTPYNFTNTVALNKNNGDIVYAGGKPTLPIQVTVGEKNNTSVGDSYATKVPGAKIKITAVYKDQNDTELSRDTTSEKSIGDLNASNILTGSTENKNQDIVVKDLPAGTKMCVTVSVYPASSGADNNVSTSNFSGWANSNEVCLIIAKKPSFQVWGSGIFSASATTMTVLTKYDGSGISDDGKTHVFGSWAELGIILGGVGKYPASGAATGYGSTNDAREAAKQSLSNTKPTISVLGGSNKGAYCWRTRLTFPNKNCTDSIAFTNSTINSIVSNLSSDKSSLVDRFNDTENKTEYDLTIYTENTNIGNLTIDGTDVIKAANNTITIDGNITYGDDDKEYTTLESIPKLIVYANNINITCNVTRIDAILIANNTIDTCSDISDVNAAGRSTQLFINGAMIADIINFRRTYGAATGLNSIVPAEIVNYDSSIFLWIDKNAYKGTDSKLNSAFMRELAPRF